MKLRSGVAVDIVTVDYVGDHCLKLTFNDGHVSAVDFGPFLRGSLNPGTRQFLDVKKFQSFAISYGNLVWGDYEMCFPVEDLYRGTIGQRRPAEKTLAVAEPRATYGAKKRRRSVPAPRLAASR